MRIIYLMIIILILCGCSINKVEDIDSQDSCTSETILENDVERNFEIILPAKAVVGECVDSTGVLSAWKINVDSYNALERYPYGDEKSLWISSGWIEIYNGEYGKDSYGNPYILWNHSSFCNYETINNGYICEVEFEVYANQVYEGNDVSYEDGLSQFWCLIFLGETTDEAVLKSDWIFLNKECFTREEALEITKTYKPSWVE